MEEQLRCQEAAEVEAEACWNEREDARFDALEHEEWEEEFDDTVENFSEHPSLSAEDDEPLSHEMEYWFTPCDKCGKYTEFCPCDGEFED